MAEFDPTARVETWHPVPSLPGYEVSTRFRVRTVRLLKRTGRIKRTIRKVSMTDKGYLAFAVKGRRYRLHWAVAEIAHGPRPEGMQVRHLDDNKLNNHPANLAYGTHRDNMADARRNGSYLTPACAAARQRGTYLAQLRRTQASRRWTQAQQSVIDGNSNGSGAETA